MTAEHPPRVDHVERAQEELRQAQQALEGIQGVGMDATILATVRKRLASAQEELDAEGER